MQSKTIWGSTAPSTAGYAVPGSWRVCQPSHSNSFVTHPDSQWRFPVIFLQIGLLFFVLLRYSLYVSGDVSGDWFNIHKCTDFSSLAEPKPSLPLNTPRELATPRRYYPENNKDERMLGKPELSRPPGRHDRPPGRHDRPPGWHDRLPGRHDRPPGRHDRPPGRHDRPPGRQDRPSYIMKYGQCSKR